MLGFEKRISLEFPGGLLIKDLAYCCSSLGLIPGLGTSVCCRCSQKKKKKKKKCSLQMWAMKTVCGVVVLCISFPFWWWGMIQRLPKVYLNLVIFKCSQNTTPLLWQTILTHQLYHFGISATLQHIKSRFSVFIFCCWFIYEHLTIMLWTEFLKYLRKIEQLLIRA